MPPWVVVGPGDDAAVIEQARGALDVLTTDALVDGVHFDRRFVPADAIGHRALAVNLSDLAAMGAEPRAALLSFVLPDTLEVAAFDGIVDGMLALAGVHKVTLVGGNITRTPGPLTIDVTAIGSVRPRRILRRTGARPGDDVYVTGTLGDAAVGLKMLLEGRPEGRPLRDGRAEMSAETSVGADLQVGPCIERYLRPEPRVRAGLLLGRNRAASSAMDLSDGLADGVRQIAEASGIGITIDAAAIPVSNEARRWHETHGGDEVAGALSGGDDYELLFTSRPAQRGRLRGVRQQMGSLAVTRIGVVTKARDLLVTGEGGPRELPAGYEHFR